MSADALIIECQSRGINLRADGCDLAIQGRLDAELRARLREHKSELLRLLITAEAADIEAMTENALEYFAERSAIAEFDGGLSRENAERQAAERVYEYRLHGWTQYGVWLGQPGDGIDAARQWCEERFGDRVVDVRPYRPREVTK